jgi:hypothetical protein
MIFESQTEKFGFFFLYGLRRNPDQSFVILNKNGAGG